MKSGRVFKRRTTNQGAQCTVFDLEQMKEPGLPCPCPSVHEQCDRRSAPTIAADLWQVVRTYRGRNAAALVCLIIAKIATVAVPLVLKRIIDAFAQPDELARLPVYLLAGYALLRFLSSLFNELRDRFFARVTLRTVSIYAQKVLAHLHALGARYHARRQIGGLLPDGPARAVPAQGQQARLGRQKPACR